MYKLLILIFTAFMLSTQAYSATTWIWLGEYSGSEEEKGVCTIICKVNNNVACFAETDDNGTEGNIYIGHDSPIVPIGSSSGPVIGNYITVTTLDPQTQSVVNTYQGHYGGTTDTDNGDGTFSSAITLQN